MRSSRNTYNGLFQEGKISFSVEENQSKEKLLQKKNIKEEKRTVRIFPLMKCNRRSEMKENL